MTAPTKDPEPTAACAALQGSPIGGLQDIDNRMGVVMMAACDAQNLASLLEAVSAEGFKEASRTDDYRSKKWWQQAEYIARVLERLGDELQANGEAIELALRDIKHGRRAS